MYYLRQLQIYRSVRFPILYHIYLEKTIHTLLAGQINHRKEVSSVAGKELKASKSRTRIFRIRQYIYHIVIVVYSLDLICEPIFIIKLKKNTTYIQIISCVANKNAINDNANAHTSENNTANIQNPTLVV